MIHFLNQLLGATTALSWVAGVYLNPVFYLLAATLSFVHLIIWITIFDGNT